MQLVYRYSMARALRWASAARAAARHLGLPTNVTVVVGDGGSAGGMSEGARAAAGLAAALAGAATGFAVDNPRTPGIIHLTDTDG
jgi:hypothetical protein